MRLRRRGFAVFLIASRSSVCVNEYESASVREGSSTAAATASSMTSSNSSSLPAPAARARSMSKTRPITAAVVRILRVRSD